MSRPIFSVCLLALISTITPAYAKDILLSEALKENFKGSVIVIEGNRFIDDASIGGIVRSNQTIREKLEQVANLADYSLQRFENGYLLSKKYTDGKEVPCTTDLEILDFSRKAKKVVDLFVGSDASSRVGVNRLVNLLTEEQLQKAKDDVLPVASMNGAQKNSFSEMIYHLYFSGLRPLGAPAGTILYPDKAAVCIDSLDREDKSLCYREPQAPLQKWPFGSISTPAVTPYAEHKRRNISFFGPSIGTITKALSDKSESVPYSCNPILAGKPVFLVNGEKASADDIVNMIARLYNLRVVNDGKGKKIDVKNTAIAQDAHLAKYLASIAPPSLIRAYAHHNLGDLTQDILKQVTRELIQKKKTEMPYKDMDELNKNCMVVQIIDRAMMELRDAQSYIPEPMRNIEVLGMKYSAGGDPAFKRANVTTFTFMIQNEDRWTQGPKISMFDHSKG
ncbi:MAG: hypothetical protein QM758_20440 [Armatimonas sp.]